MDFSKETALLSKAIDFIQIVMDAPLDKLSKKEFKHVMSTLAQCVDDIYYIDDLMPLEEFADKFDKRKDREAFLHVLDLLDEAFSLLDELLGPEVGEMEAADEIVPDEDSGGDLYAELIRNMKPGRHTS